MRYPAILLYHQIEDKDNINIYSDRTCISKNEFIKQISLLLDNKWQFVSLKQLLNALINNNIQENIISLTFDDAYQDIFSISDFLFHHKIPASVFFCTDYVSKPNLWNTKAHQIKQHLSISDMEYLESKNFSFEFHGKDHHRLTKFDNNKLEKHLNEGITDYIKIFNHSPEIIAYPYGDYNKEVIDIVKGTFSFGLSVTQGGWNGNKNRFCFNRYEITNWMTAEFIASILTLVSNERAGFYNMTKDNYFKK